MDDRRVIILGAGMTGLAAGYATGLPLYEATQTAGGICSSYYMRSGSLERMPTAPIDKDAYRFEIGGGHWIFGGDPMVLRFINLLTPVKAYSRRSSVFFPDSKKLVPYPLQNNLRHLGQKVAAQVLQEVISERQYKADTTTMAEWLRTCFGSTLSDIFFEPFHDLYTAGLCQEIAPQDAYKTPINFSHVIQGAFDDVPQAGYNVNFVYPEEGLDTLSRRMAERCDIHYGKCVSQIDVQKKIVHFKDSTSERYDELISTLPLNRIMDMTKLDPVNRSDPASTVLVINVGAIKGSKCPSEHWLYIPKSRSGFHRVGFYSNIDSSFLPASSSEIGQKVSIYIEKAYREDEKPGQKTIERLCTNIVQELKEWDWVDKIEVMDTTWIEVAYTWSFPGSLWRQKALKLLEEHSIYQVGRYARWTFQGIADSIRDGFITSGWKK